MTTTTKNNVTMEAIPIMMATITTNGFSDQSLATTTTKNTKLAYMDLKYDHSYDIFTASYTNLYSIVKQCCCSSPGWW